MRSAFAGRPLRQQLPP